MCACAFPPRRWTGTERTLGLVFNGDTNLNLALVREGLALPYLVHPAMGMADEFADACAEARREGRGVFAPGRALPEEPARFRLRLSGRAPYWWVGSLRTKRYGPSESFDRYLPEERILFESEERATCRRVRAGGVRGKGVRSGGKKIRRESPGNDRTHRRDKNL